MSVPLQKQLVELLFHKGVNTKGDPFQISIGELIVLQNATFTSPGKIQKRNGYAALTQSILGGGGSVITNPTALFVRDNELLQIGGAAANTLYGYDRSNQAWVTRGTMPSVGVSVESAAQPQFSTFSIDMAQAPNGLRCFVYELVDMNAAATGHGLGYTIVDPSTGQIVVPPSVLDSTATAGNPHVICLGNTFVCYYVVGVIAVSSAILGRTLSSTTPLSGWSASTTLTSGAALLALSLARLNFDVVADAAASNAYMIFNNGSGSLTLTKILSASPLAFGGTATIATTGSIPTVFMDFNGNAIVGIDGVAAKFTVYDTTLSLVKALTSFASSADSGAAMTGVSTAPGEFTLFYSTAPATNSQTISSGTVSGTNYGTIVNKNPVVRSIGIAAKAFALNGLPYLPAWFCFNTSSGGLQRFNTPQNALYVIDATGRVVSKALVGTTGGYETISLFNIGSAPSYQLGATLVSGLTAVFPASNTNQLIAEVQNSRFGQVDPGTSPLLLNYSYGASAISMAFGDSTNAYQRVQFANSVYTNGGVLQMYDGNNVVEHGFLVYPAFINVSLAGGGGLSAGKYQAVAVYEWTDGQGKVHRSTPSVPVSFVATAGQSATYVVPTLSLTQKTGVVVQIYRTLVNGTVFFQETNFNAQGSLFNAPLAPNVSWTDTQSDAAIAGNPQLYTTGGVLENAPCAPAGAMVVHRNRVFVIDPTTGQIWFSKQFTAIDPLEFSGFQVLNVDPSGGKPIALASLDDKLIVFKAARVSMILGQGPDATGNQNDFTDLIPVSSDTGCTSPKSVVVVPAGIMFQSPKGIYQLDRALNMKYIGMQVEQFVNTVSPQLVVVAAALRPFQNSVYFTCTGVTPAIGPRILVYDYLIGQWSVFTLGNVVNSTVFDSVMIADTTGASHIILGDLSPVQETPGLYADPLQPVAVRWVTGWIKLSGLQGFQRARRVYVLGNWLSSISMTIFIRYDYSTTVAQVTTFGFFSDPNPMQFMIHLAQQKCESIQIECIEIAQGGAGASFSGLAFELAGKNGAFKLPASKTTG